MSDKLKNVWTQLKAGFIDESLVFKANDPNNKEGRVSPFKKDFWKKPYGKSNKKK